MARKVGATIAIVVISFVVFAAAYSYLHPDDAPPYVFSLPEDGDNGMLTFDQRLEYGKETLTFVNAERAKNGLRSLTWSDQLAGVAAAHSQRMADSNRFEHSGNQYYNCMGETILMQENSFIYPQRVVNAWMNSPGHRAAILFESHLAGGVGIVQASNGDTYYTLIMDSPIC